MDEPYSTKRLLVLRKLTRAVADLLRGQLRDYLGTLAYPFRPRAVLGEFVQSGTKEAVAGADKAFKELQALYEQVAGAKPFHLDKELKPPVEIVSSAVEVAPLEYRYEAKGEGGTKAVTITSPLKWVVGYSGYSPKRLKELAGDRSRTDPLQELLLHCLVLHVVVTRQAGLNRILDGLRFPLRSERRPEFYDVPVPYLTAAVTTLRPPDEVIIESTEISGTDAFEEVVNLGDIARMRDPLREELLGLVQAHGLELPAAEPPAAAP